MNESLAHGELDIAAELERIELLEPEARAAALEALEAKLRASLDSVSGS